MGLKAFIKQLAHVAGYEISKIPSLEYTARFFDEDNLRTSNNHDFIHSPRFIAAYNRGRKAWPTDYMWRWRVHVGLWTAAHVKNVQGDFVECGVNKGFLSSAIMHYLDWNSLNKQFFLFDTFEGLDERYVSKMEKQCGRVEYSKRHYAECLEEVKANFSGFKNVHLVRGSVPDTLASQDIKIVCYLSLDMNCAAPEIAAANFFWDKLSGGAIMLLDDYGFPGFEEQKHAFDKFADERSIEVLSSPTGQGIIMKP